jgi:hypothetical protein
MMRRMIGSWRSSLAFLLLGLLVVACSGEKQAPLEKRDPNESSVGWAVFATPGFELSLPGGFAGGSSKELIDGIARSFRDKGLEQRAVEVEAASKAALLYLVDMKDTDSQTNVRVAAFPVPRNVTLEEISRQNTGGLSQGKSVKELTYPTLGSMPAIRTLITDDIRKSSTLIYSVKSADKLWVIAYQTLSSNYAALSLMFDKSARTITLK